MFLIIYLPIQHKKPPCNNTKPKLSFKLKLQKYSSYTGGIKKIFIPILVI